MERLHDVCVVSCAPPVYKEKIPDLQFELHIYSLLIPSEFNRYFSLLLDAKLVELEAAQ